MVDYRFASLWHVRAVGPHSLHSPSNVARGHPPPGRNKKAEPLVWSLATQTAPQVLTHLARKAG